MLDKPPSKKPNEITLPDGFEAPPKLTDGGEFEAVAKIKREGDKFCIVELDGMPMPGYDEESDEKTRDDETSEEDTVGKRVMRKAIKENY